jgi:hypothetical protein
VTTTDRQRRWYETHKAEVLERQRQRRANPSADEHADAIDVLLEVLAR